VTLRVIRNDGYTIVTKIRFNNWYSLVEVNYPKMIPHRLLIPERNRLWGLVRQNKNL
jgi:hypothetical protein